MPKNKIGDIVLGIIAALVFLGAVFSAFYFNNKNNETTVILNSKQQEIKSLQQKIKDYPKTIEKLNQLEIDKDRLMHFIPDKEGQKEFIWELENLADLTGVSISQCNIEKDVKHFAKLPQYDIYQWKILLKGSYTSLVAFLDKLPGSQRAAMVSSLNVTSQDVSDIEKKKNATLNYILTVDITLDLVSKNSQEKVAK